MKFLPLPGLFAIAIATAVPLAQQIPDGVSASDWASIRAAYEHSSHSAFAVDGGYQTRNQAQRWQTRFDGASKSSS